MQRELTQATERGSYVFGEYRLDPQECRLWRATSPVPLPPKTFDLLLVLVENAGQLLEKETLLRAVWPDTFVEEGNLSVYVSALRKIFGKVGDRDYIETIPKRGYRFNVPVTKCLPLKEPFFREEAEDLTSVTGILEHPIPALPIPSSSLREESRRSWNLYILWVLLAVACVVIAFFLFRTKRSAEPSVLSGNSRPLTSLPGHFSRPSFSADGQRLAYSWRANTESYRSIYIQDVASDERNRLTNDTEDSFSPAWSPMGEEIAFLRSTGPSSPLEVIVANVHAPSTQRRLTTLTSKLSTFRRSPSLSWSPDRRWLLTTEGDLATKSTFLVLISIDDGSKRILTHAPPQTGDDEAAFSPDGESVAFRRSLGSSSDDIYIVPTKGGSEKRLTYQTLSIDGLTWSADGQSIIVSSGRATSIGSLWRVSLKGGEPVALTTPLVHTSDPVISATAHRLAYVNLLRNVSVWRIATEGHTEPEQLIASNFLDSAADYSPDGSHIAFRSDRSGANEIWICRSDGKQPRRVTGFHGPMTGSPKWSPDGQWLTFDSRSGGRSAIFMVNAAGGTPIKITSGSFDSADNVVPSWSHDGRSIYFSSNRTGQWQIWNKRISGDGEKQITVQGGFNGLESPDGQSIYFVHDIRKTSIWRVPVNGGESMQVLESLGPGMWGYWAVTSSDLFYMEKEPNGTETANIFRLVLATGTKEKLGHTQFSVNSDDKGLAVSPDGRWLLYAQRDVDRSTIMIVDGWN